MSSIRALRTCLLLSTALSGTGVLAGEAVVTWQNPEKYADIETDDLDQQAFQARLFKPLEKEFSQQAGRLPEGSRLTVTVTNLDLAGERRIRNDGDYMRVVNDGYFPKMALDYTVTDAAGAVVSGQRGMDFSDLGFLDANAAIRANQSPQAFYYETQMVRHWFDDTLGADK